MVSQTMAIFLVFGILATVNGNIINGVSGERRRSMLSNSSVANLWFESGDTNITAHWQLPPTAIDADFCVIVYKADAEAALTIRIPVAREERQFVINGLNQNQLYEIRLYCVHGGRDGNSTQKYYISTRSVSVDPPICSGSLPNAALESYCLEYPSWRYCQYTCHEGYRVSKVPDVIRGRRNKPSSWPLTVRCQDGIWITRYEDEGFNIQNMCLPESVFHQCPTTIPHGQLELLCGPDTDWLCEFECDQGYYKHTYMSGILKNFFNREYMLYCDGGIWKTGYENLGVDVSKVCVPAGPNCTNDNDIPHGSVKHLPCPSGHVCGFECDEGYRKHGLVWDDPSCSAGEWILRTTKYDPSITPESMCVLSDVVQDCPRNIHHGGITDNCTVRCFPQCESGYEHPLETHLNGPGLLTCENGKWLTDEAPYTGANICFPVNGHKCPLEIENGISSTYNWSRIDDGSSRGHISYTCNEGFRKHRSVYQLECIAGKWVTWQERFGIDTSAICIPLAL